MATKQVQSMVSEVSIANQALSWVGANQITSFDDPSTEAEWCRANYPFLRDAVLEERMWTFATDRAMSQSIEPPTWGDGLFKHALPNNWLQVFRVYDHPDSRLEDWVQWYREGAFVLAEAETIYLWGTKRITDTGAFSLMFVQALAARMASEMAIPLAENRSLQRDLWELYMMKLREAAAHDGYQGQHKIKQRSGHVDSRRGYVRTR